MVADINRRLADKQLTVELTPAAKELVIDSAYDPVYGARPLRRFLQHTVETLVSKKIIADRWSPAPASRWTAGTGNSPWTPRRCSPARSSTDNHASLSER